jgi:hypothetical protein
LFWQLFFVSSQPPPLNHVILLQKARRVIPNRKKISKLTGYGQLILRLVTKGINSIYQNPIPEFDVAPLFEKLSTDDYERTVDLAGGFAREAPRANAVLAIAHSVLAEKKGQSPAKSND